MEKHLQPVKIVLTGPESTGKTTLASILSQGYNRPLVKETCRDFLIERNNRYKYSDLETMARLQIREEIIQSSKAESFLFCDTDSLTYITWGVFRFGKIFDWVLDEFHNSDNLYVLCGTDVPWVPDPLRDNPQDREALYDLHLSYLEDANKTFIEVTGSIEERIKIITAFIDSKFL